ncbi:Fe3+-hydroxamate ABC transporter substrate-binding protein [Hahella sp. CCB-MM4]|uniref:ABC transporter substrate-binding protein n=1 Tax=Hahella sp. (strain CCB-MM4) TaxID=1926491 RepID=UPI000B9B2EED|nr:ABC transporter substrate-binding protein [Hahella sp. CCB-MM4]OZG75354.1 Fe3+-hydroxamate ABC transporter substrate-binding protein [Hahella sp. CCB-MM4]
MPLISSHFGMAALLLWSLTGTSMARAADVMSVNQCVDQMVGYLAPDRLSSVTWLSHEQTNLEIFPLLKAIPANHGEIEEVMNLQPAMIIGGQFGAPGLKSLVKKFGYDWHELSLPQDLDALYRNWEQLGAWLGQESRAHDMVTRLQTGLGDIQKNLAPLNIQAMVVNANGWVAGNDNFQDAYLRALGLSNIAAERGIQGWGQVSLEQLIYWQPDLIIVPDSLFGGQARATQWMDHPALKKVHSRYPMVKVDAGWLSCGTPALLRAAKEIQRHILQHENNPSASVFIHHVVNKESDHVT